MNFKNLKIGTKLTIGFSAILLLTIVTGFVGYRSLQIVNENSENSAKLSQLNIQMLEARRQEKNFELRGLEKYGTDTKNSVDKLRDICTETFRQIEILKGQLDVQKEIQEVDLLKEILNSYLLSFEKFVSLKTSNQSIEIIKKVNDEMVENARKFHAGVKKLDEIYNSKKYQSITRANSLILIFLAFSVLLGIIIALVITKSIVTGIKKGVDFSIRVSNGDLTATIDLEQTDEIGLLANSLSKMSTKLNEIVKHIIDGANHLSSASQQISSGAQQMSQGANEQAASIEEVSSSMEEMLANIEQNSDNAQQTEKIASNSNIGINKGYNSAKNSVESMKKIAEKILIINDIALQTNLLALNAAVEAARAGEHGKGFAVVSAEVRKLAERSRIAANEINDLTNSGVYISEDAGNQLNAIIPEIEKTTQLVREIAASSLEQNSGAKQVNTAIQQLNQVTLQNATASEELATASEELASQAEQLKDLVSFFTT